MTESETVIDEKRVDRMPQLDTTARGMVDIFTQLLCNVEPDADRTLESTTTFLLSHAPDWRTVTLQLSTKIGFFPLKWDFFARLSKESPAIIKNEFILPLFSTQCELSRRIEALYEILAQKERQINEYKKKNIAIQKAFQYPPFVVPQFEAEMKSARIYNELVSSPQLEVASISKPILLDSCRAFNPLQEEESAQSTPPSRPNLNTSSRSVPRESEKEKEKEREEEKEKDRPKNSGLSKSAAVTARPLNGPISPPKPPQPQSAPTTPLKRKRDEMEEGNQEDEFIAKRRALEEKLQKDKQKLEQKNKKKAWA